MKKPAFEVTTATAGQVDQMIRDEYKTSTPAKIAEKLNAQGAVTPRGNKISAQWVSNRANAMKVYRGTAAANRTKREQAKRTPNKEAFRASQSKGSFADVVTFLTTNKALTKTQKLGMLSVIM